MKDNRKVPPAVAERVAASLDDVSQLVDGAHDRLVKLQST